MVIFTKSIANHGITCDEKSFCFLHFRGSFVKVMCNGSNIFVGIFVETMIRKHGTCFHGVTFQSRIVLIVKYLMYLLLKGTQGL